MKLKFSKPETSLFDIERRITNQRGHLVGTINRTHKKQLAGIPSEAIQRIRRVRLSLTEDAFYSLTPEQLEEIKTQARSMR